MRAALARRGAAWAEDERRERNLMALTRSDLATGEAAEWLACTMLGAQNATHTARAGHAWAFLAAALLDDYSPDPAAAADAGKQALTVTTDTPDPAVWDRVRRLHHDLAQRWPDLPETIGLGKLLDSSPAPAS